MLLKQNQSSKRHRSRKHIFSLLLCVPLMATAMVPLTALGQKVQNQTTKQREIINQIITVNSVDIMRKKVKEIKEKNKSARCTMISNTKTRCYVTQLHKQNRKNLVPSNNITIQTTMPVYFMTNLLIGVTKQLNSVEEPKDNVKNVTIIEIQVKPSTKAKK